MYDIIKCEDKLKIPRSFTIYNIDIKKEPFKTNCFNRKLETYFIKDGKFFKEKNNELIEIFYTGFVTFYTHFFDDPPTEQIYISYIAEFKDGKVLYIKISEFKKYCIKKENLKANFFMTLFNLFKFYLRK